MKKKHLFYLLLFIGLYACSNDNIEMAHFTISSKDIITGAYLKGAQYRILNTKNQEVAIYTLDNGSIEVSNLQGNNYIIEEITPPSGYVGLQKEKKYQYFNSNSENFIFLYTNAETRELPKSVKMKFYASDQYTYYGDYNGILIGEYYWTDKNFTHTVPHGKTFENDYPVTQNTLDTYMPYINIDKSAYQLEDINDFQRYYGRHYSYPSILFMKQQGFMINEYNEKEAGWKLPSPEDYRQLMAMCPFNTSHDPVHTVLNERDVRFALGPKPYENPLAYNLHRPGPFDVYWFDQVHNTNMYNFSLMPGGARLNGDGLWCNGLGCQNGKKGDFHGLFYAAYMAVDNPKDPLAIGAVVIHDFLDTKEVLLYHFMSVRWCRRLTDLELGYKLYINADQTDIKKLDLVTQAPEGYKELPQGYIRGFYVQYILNKENPTVSVSDIVSYARKVEDNYVYENSKNANIIL